MAKTKEFKPTKINFKIRGIIARLENDNAYKEDDDKDMWHRIRFGVKTSKTNEVPVELFGYKGDAYYWSKEKGATIKRSYEDRYDKPTEVKDAHLIGVQINTSGSKDGAENLHAYDAVEKIREDFADGDSVQITGQVEYSTYEKEGKTVVQKSYSIGRITKFTEAIDFDAESFKEVSAFEGAVVFREIVKEKEDDGKETVTVESRIITKKDGSYVDTELNIPTYNTKMANAFKKNLKWGDEIRIKGLLRNEAVVEEVEVEEDDEWGSEEVAGYGQPIKTFKRSMDILAFDKDFWKEGDESKGIPKGKGRYTEEDFEVDEFNEDGAESFDDDEDDDWSAD